MTSVFLRFLNLSITAGWMVLAVLLLRLCLKKAPRWITCVLWGLVALRLILPFTIESPISLIPTAQTVVSTEGSDDTTPVVDSGLSAIDKPLNDWLQAPVETPVEKPSQSPIVQSPVPSLPPDTNVDTNVDTDTDTNTDIGTDTTPITPDKEPQAPTEETKPETVKTVSRMEKILNVVAPIWLVGIGLMLAYELFSLIRVRSRVWDAVRLRDNIWQSDRVASPFIFGLFRPRIYVPYGLEEPVLEQVLSHERAHLHRRDHWIKPFAFTLLAVYWYNPLLWVGYILLCRDIEVACDERVVRGLDDDNRRQYATALLQCGVERRSIAACPLAFGEVSIKQRIKSVLNYRKPLLWVIIVSLVVCAVAAVCLLTVPKSKPADSKPKDSSTEEEESIVVLSSKVIKPDQVRQFFSQDTDGALVEAGRNWMWEHAENPDVKTPDVDRWEETNIPLVVSRSKADLDALMDACSNEDPYGVDMRDWFELEKYDDAYFEDKVIVWLFVPGYDLGYYDYAITLEETNKGLRYAVSLEYESMSMFDPWPGRCEYLLLFETDRKLIEEAKTLTTRHEQAPFELPEEDGLTMVPVGNIDLDGDGEKEEIRLYHSELNLDTGWDSGYETAYLVVCKADGTVLLREETFYCEHSQCYLVTQEDGTCLLLLLEAGDLEYAYSDEEFGVLSLKDGVRTVLDNKYESMHPTGWNGISFGTLAPYVLTLSDWLENAQLLYECDNGTIRYGADVTAQYQPLCWLDKYRDSDDDTLQDILETILASLGGETVSCGEMDFDNDGDNETLSVLRYVDEDGIYQHNVLVVRKADGSILTAAQIHYDYVNETRGLGSYVYWVRTENGYVLKRADRSPYTEGLSVYELSIDGMTYVDDMATEEWLDYVEAHDGELLFYFQGLEMYFPNEDSSNNFLNEDATKYTVTNYNPSMMAYNAFLKGQKVAYEYGDHDTIFYVSDLYATVNDKGIKRYALADVTGDGVPELITEGYSMSVFTYQSGRLLRLYESRAGACKTLLLSNGCLWEERCGAGVTYWYTKFFEIGTTRTIEFGVGYFSYGNEYHIERVDVSKADYDARTATYFANAQSPALLLWYDYATKQPTSQAMVQYLSLLQKQYQNRSDAYYALHDTDGDGEQELLVKVGDTIVIGLPNSNSILSDAEDIDWVSFKKEPVYLVDMTFDGFQDVAVCVDNVYGKIFAVLRWDTQLEKLVMMPTTLQNPAVDSQNAIVRTSRSGDQIVSYSMWSYDEEQKDFVRTHSLYFHQNEQATGDDDKMELVVTENGKTKTLYVRGEPYALDKTDPQVAPYYVPGSLWDLDGLQWEAMQWAKKDPYGNYAGYAALLKAEYPNQKIEYALRDLNADGRTDLLVLEDGTTLSVYTKKDGFTHLLVAQDFVSGTSRFLTTGDADYPGIIYFCVGGVKDRYYYLSLDNVENGEFVKIPLWTDNYSLYEEGEEGRITELSDDKKLIELSREAYQNNRDLVFALYGGSASTVALDIKYRQAVQAYSSDSKNHRDVGALQPETMDIIQIDGKYYQTYVSGAVDMRYIWLSQYEADIGIASWDWVPIGTEDDYSLSNIGKMDYVHRVPVALQPVVGNRQTFIYQGKSVLLSDLLSQYNDEIGRYAVVDFEGDGKLELAVEFKTQNFILVLWNEADTCYGYLFSFRSMYRINTDGSFHWNSSAGDYGCSSIQLSGGTWKDTELWRVERDGNESTYYVDGKKVSEAEFESLTAETESEVLWYSWT